MIVPRPLYVIWFGPAQVGKRWYAAHEPGQYTGDPTSARKFSAPADAYCWLESYRHEFDDVYTAEVVRYWPEGPP